ncbi:MAG: UbiA-like polyprenyltransferase [Planctomycetota bacterium]|nr:UbiA-like polyprenyltransferase [Planctomycetota bacterium]
MSADPGSKAGSLGDWLSLVKFSHSIFALPFALIALLLATGGRPPLRMLALVVVAAVAARTAAMAFNRWVDRDIDQRNPRTVSRELVTGKIGAPAALALALAASAIFLLASGMLNALCAALSPFVLIVLLGYSYTKRFTWACHLILGLALALAPLGAWFAATGSFVHLTTPLLLAGAVLTWVAGFDVIYACQDVDFDRSLGLRSIPARLGVRRALQVARLLHVVTVALLACFGVHTGLGVWWWVGYAAACSLLVYEHTIVSPHDLSRVNAAFFTVNGCLSIVLAVLTAIDLWVAPIAPV